MHYNHTPLVLYLLTNACTYTHTCTHVQRPFWDIVVVTARDEEQRKSYEEQIELKKARAEIPGFVK